MRNCIQPEMPDLRPARQWYTLGGLGGAEGAITLILKGKADEVNKALDFVEQSKGARLPDLRLCNCNDCPVPNCRFAMADKQWISE